ncbi:protein translocase subunit SecA [Striga asiatica]|uniref:Protein translocase subunit SecA n=1 Tax=Striga asiatica TaxID=4170 RepID=A0A5A7QWB0_STRAF|nr:protein translocase subunit SecA [Striga asiatica]
MDSSKCIYNECIYAPTFDEAKGSFAKAAQYYEQASSLTGQTVAIKMIRFGKQKGDLIQASKPKIADNRLTRFKTKEPTTSPGDERLKHHLMASKELHPALISPECEYKVQRQGRTEAEAHRGTGPSVVLGPHQGMSNAPWSDALLVNS